MGRWPLGSNPGAHSPAVETEDLQSQREVRLHDGAAQRAQTDRSPQRLGGGGGRGRRAAFPPRTVRTGG
jgi:hypothetical protein